jgi:hypothetical protein
MDAQGETETTTLTRVYSAYVAPKRTIPVAAAAAKISVLLDGCFADEALNGTALHYISAYVALTRAALGVEFKRAIPCRDIHIR